MKTIEMIYIGNADKVSVKRFRVTAFRIDENPFTDTRDKSEILCFSGRLAGLSLTVGDYLTCEQVNEKQYKNFQLTAYPLFQLPHDEVLQYSVTHRARLSKESALKRLKNSNSTIENLIKDLRTAMSDSYLSHSERSALAMYVYQKLI